eukprot:c17676_g1_i5.p1 GENE.c17676_g1_i5~~c17676_g1_i5.p1  ORF type:complete len:117 (+),score=11.76 c17676_g1_i5:381-731(+)
MNFSGPRTATSVKNRYTSLRKCGVISPSSSCQKISTHQASLSVKRPQPAQTRRLESTSSGSPPQSQLLQFNSPIEIQQNNQGPLPNFRTLLLESGPPRDATPTLPSLSDILFFPGA